MGLLASNSISYTEEVRRAKVNMLYFGYDFNKGYNNFITLKEFGYWTKKCFKAFFGLRTKKPENTGFDHK